MCVFAGMVDEILDNWVGAYYRRGLPEGIRNTYIYIFTYVLNLWDSEEVWACPKYDLEINF